MAVERIAEKTRLVYHEDTYQFVGTGKLLSIEKAEDGSQVILIFDQTIFHPQGGGQPSDRGFICSLPSIIDHLQERPICHDREEKEEEIGKRVLFQVINCQYNRQKGIVKHYCQRLKKQEQEQEQEQEGEEEEEPIKIGEEYEQRIDSQARRLYAAIHSTGHLLDTAMKQAGRGDLIPSKGSHGPTGAYVEYEGNLEPHERATLAARLQDEFDALLTRYPEAATQIHVAHSVEEVARLCGPSSSSSSSSSSGCFLPSRIVVLGVDSFGCPCGGTHIQKISDLAPFRISVGKITKKGKYVRVSYQVTPRS
jgi:Ser-tRNA(Ala) deacylase AlaX